MSGQPREASKEIDKGQKRNAITGRQYGSLKIGALTKSEVISRYGQPDSADDFESKDIGGSDCIYYNKKDGQVGDFFQLCFDKSGGKLESKSGF